MYSFRKSSIVSACFLQNFDSEDKNIREKRMHSTSRDIDTKKSIRGVPSRTSKFVNATRSPSNVIEIVVMNFTKEYLDSICLLLNLSYSIRCFSIILLIFLSVIGYVAQRFI